MKNTIEWSQEFDLMYNNIMSDKAPGLEEYEKSVFLTRAEEAVAIAVYKGSLGDSFEATEEITDYLATLVDQVTLTSPSNEAIHIVPSSVVYSLPEDFLFRTYESCGITVDGCGTMTANVVPVTQDEFWRTSRNPFKKQNSSRVLRLAFGKSDEVDDNLSEAHYTELVSDYPVASYTLRYMRKPDPIILEPLEGGLSINGKTEQMTCKMPEALHQTILTEAVKLAKAVWQ